jgi:fatty acyl-CoA reductase
MNGEPSGRTATKRTPAAFFDVDDTLSSTNVIRTYLDFWLQGLPRRVRLFRLAWFLPKVPYYVLLDTISRARFSQAFFKNYARVERSGLDTWAESAVERYWRPRLFPQALERLRRHREEGHRIVLVSGGVEPVLRPLARLLEVDVLVAAELETRDGHLTGRLLHGPMSAERKAEATRRVGADLNLDLERSYAYSDSYSDRAFLESIGNPVAVNPDWRLRNLARARGWPIEQWRHR